MTQTPQTLPKIAIQTTNNAHSNLQDYLGKHLVLYFYPKDDTPGCTVEANDFQSLKADFARLDAQVVGVSKDSLQSHEKFCSKFSLEFELISDGDGAVCEAFGVWVEKSMYGKKYMGIERATFLFDKSGQLVTQWRSVTPKGHAQAVLEALKEHASAA